MRIVVSYRGIPQSPGWATGDSVVRALRKLGHDVFPYGNYYQTGQRLADAVPFDRPDLLIWMECNDADPQYTELLDWSCPKVLWDFDTAMHAGFTRDLAQRFDRVFLANPRYLDIPRSSYLPYAFDPDLMQPSPKRSYQDKAATVDLFNQPDGAAIIGSRFPERERFAAEVGLEIITGKYRQEYVDAVAGLRVHVHQHASGGAGLLVMRIWETLGLGTCLLTEPDDTLLRHFVPDRHLVVYEDAADCKRKLTRLLDTWHDEVIASAGRAEVMAKHTYLHRVQELLAAL